MAPYYLIFIDLGQEYLKIMILEFQIIFIASENITFKLFTTSEEDELFYKLQNNYSNINDISTVILLM